RRPQLFPEMALVGAERGAVEVLAAAEEGEAVGDGEDGVAEDAACREASNPLQEVFAPRIVLHQGRGGSGVGRENPDHGQRFFRLRGRDHPQDPLVGITEGISAEEFGYDRDLEEAVVAHAPETTYFIPRAATPTGCRPTRPWPG